MATVDVQGTVNGEQVDTQRVHSLPVAIEQRTYSVGQVDGRSVQETTRQVTVPREYGPVRRLGGPALLGLSVAGLAGLAVARSRDELELTEADRAWLAYREEREEFDEWITTFALPPEAFDRPVAEAESLADLVDFAIDTNGGVIESPDGSAYYVLDEEFRYTYTPPASPLPPGEGEEDEPRLSAPADPTDGAVARDSPDEADGSAGDVSDGDDGSPVDDDRAERSKLERAALDLGLGSDETDNGTAGETSPEGPDDRAE